MAGIALVNVFTLAGDGNPCPVVADAAGLDAAALAFELLRDGADAPDDWPIRIVQGRAMGRASEIRVRLGFAGGRAIGCLLEGDVAEGGA